ncbi:MAG: DUF2953 domain-containing protein, partial [Lachnospiraceae bacterium]|nr:DUF2953 domain-containing protein [Lachnospiraceae bacterium]
PDGLYGRFLEKLGAFREKYRELRRKALFVTDERTGEAISYVLLQVRKLVRHIAPKRVEGELHFGFDSPADTGMVYAYLCRLFPAAEDFYLDPDFTEACLDGEAALEGRVYAGYIVLVGLRLLLKKEVRFVLKNYKKYFGKENGAPENGKPAAAEA